MESKLTTKAEAHDLKHGCLSSKQGLLRVSRDKGNILDGEHIRIRFPSSLLTTSKKAAGDVNWDAEASSVPPCLPFSHTVGCSMISQRSSN